MSLAWSVASAETHEYAMKYRTEGIRHVVISPHLDDAVISMGGTIVELIGQSKDLMVVTVFAGKPESTVQTNLVRQLNELGGLMDDAVQTRIAEDIEVMDYLGAKSAHLDFLDCIYRTDNNRNPQYPTVEDIFDTRTSERQLELEICSSLRSLNCWEGAAAVYTCLGIGDHIDHRTVRRATEALFEASNGHMQTTLYYYEDLPYALKAQSSASKKRAIAELQMRLNYISDVAWRRKMIMTELYRSQMRLLWGDSRTMRIRSGEYARGLGRGRYVERMWRKR